MLKRAFIIVAATVLVAGPGFAQTTAPAATTPPPPATATPSPATTPSLTKDGKPRMKEVREQCREEVKAGALKGDARRQAMGDCIIKQRPDMEARVKCSMDPSLKGMDKDARRTAVKACIDKSKT